jgi:hypothetical protein
MLSHQEDTAGIFWNLEHECELGSESGTGFESKWHIILVYAHLSYGLSKEYPGYQVDNRSYDSACLRKGRHILQHNCQWIMDWKHCYSIPKYSHNDGAPTASPGEKYIFKILENYYRYHNLWKLFKIYK